MKNMRIDQLGRFPSLRHNTVRQPEFVVIGNRKSSLQTIYALVGGKARRGKTQLVRRRSVFCVVYDEKVPTRADSAILSARGFVFRLARRSDDDLVVRGQAQFDDPTQSLEVSLFDDQLNVELILGIVERVKRVDQVLDDVGSRDKAPPPRCRREARRLRASAWELRACSQSPPSIAATIAAEKINQSAADATVSRTSNLSPPRESKPPPQSLRPPQFAGRSFHAWR